MFANEPLDFLQCETPCEQVKFWRQSLAREEFAREGAKAAKTNFFFASFASAREPGLMLGLAVNSSEFAAKASGDSPSHQILVNSERVKPRTTRSASWLPGF
jgi:hypothetical protein